MSLNKIVYRCNYPNCGKTFRRKYDWGRHLDSHLGCMYHCKFCDKGFTRPGGLNNHLTICKLAKSAVASEINVITAEDGTILDATPVAPIKVTVVGTPSTSTPPKNSLEKHAWIAMDKCTSTQRAIQILSKTNCEFQPATPSVTDSAPRMNKLATHTATSPSSSTATRTSSTTDDPTSAPTKTLKMPPQPASTDKPVKRVKFDTGYTLVPPPAVPKRDGFKPCGTRQKQLTLAADALQQSTNECNPKHPKAPGQYKVEPIEGVRRNPRIQPNIPFNQLRSQPRPIPLEMRLDVADPRQGPGTVHKKDTPSSPPPQLNPSCNMDGTGGSPFITEPSSTNTLWNEIMKTPDRLISPLPANPSSSPKLAPGDQTKSPPSIENYPGVINDIGSDILGSISPDSDTAEPKGHTSPMEITEDICTTTNTMIIDIITELSLINERSLTKNMGKYKTSLDKILKKLRKVTKDFN